MLSTTNIYDVLVALIGAVAGYFFGYKKGKKKGGGY